MPGPIQQLMAADHARLDRLLSEALAEPGVIDRAAFDAFRQGLLRHIALEEKILFPAAKRAQGGRSLAVARRLRVEHGALAALLVPTPTPGIAGEIRSLLAPHNALEEGDGGPYQLCDALLAPESAEIFERLRSYPPVKVGRYQDGPRACRTAEEALRVSSLQHARDD